jgi:hypothetical protein
MNMMMNLGDLRRSMWECICRGGAIVLPSSSATGAMQAAHDDQMLLPWDESSSSQFVSASNKGHAIMNTGSMSQLGASVGRRGLLCLKCAPSNRLKMFDSSTSIIRIAANNSNNSKIRMT